jgi:assimilatory nitrate reductase catalytic subunit
VAFTPVGAVPAPPLDSYSFRLVATRKLYDQGTIVQAGNHLADLAPGTAVRVSPYDFDRLGVAAGDTVSVSSPRATLMMPIHADAGVARGSAAVVINQADHQVTQLMSIIDVVTELRIETTK